MLGVRLMNTGEMMDSASPLSSPGGQTVTEAVAAAGSPSQKRENRQKRPGGPLVRASKPRRCCSMVISGWMARYTGMARAASLRRIRLVRSGTGIGLPWGSAGMRDGEVTGGRNHAPFRLSDEAPPSHPPTARRCFRVGRRARGWSTPATPGIASVSAPATTHVTREFLYAASARAEQSLPAPARFDPSRVISRDLRRSLPSRAQVQQESVSAISEPPGHATDHTATYTNPFPGVHSGVGWVNR